MKLFSVLLKHSLDQSMKRTNNGKAMCEFFSAVIISKPLHEFRSHLVRELYIKIEASPEITL
jgi:hypothetical protein